MPSHEARAAVHIGPVQAFQLRRSLAITPPTAGVVVTVGVMSQRS